MDQNQDLDVITLTHEAHRLRLAGQCQEAIQRLLKKELLEAARAARYPTFFLALAECYAELGARANAIAAVIQALEFAPNSPAALLLFEKLQRAARAKPTLSDLMESEEAPAPDATELEDLASKLSNHISVKPGLSKTEEKKGPAAEALEEPEELGLVSETLARIMVQQGKYDEARKIYVQLARQDPHRFEYYHDKMEELDKLIEDK